MDKIKIITDTASDISLEEANKYDIELAPVTITIDGKSYRELYDISKEEYWKILEESEELPKTSQITPQMFLNLYKKFYDEGYDKFIVVTMNAKGSGTFNSANLASEMFKEENEDFKGEFKIIDSAGYTYCYGKPVINAAIMLTEGKSYNEVCSYLEERLPKMKAFAYMSTLKYARVSGRISILSAIVGEALGLKPVLKLHNGSVDVFNKARGEKMALATIISNVKEDAYDLENEELIIVYGSVDESSLEKVKAEVKEKLNPKSIQMCKLGCSITTNAGPQTIGILYCSK